jgi:hypothetical protein
MTPAFPKLRYQRASRKMLYLRDQYLKAFPNAKQPLDPQVIAKWAYEKGLWKPREVDPREVLRRKLVRAFRTEYITDPQNREIRAGIAAIEEVMTPEGPKRMARFYRIFEAPQPVAEQHYQLQRRLAVENAVQLDLELDSYNENNVAGAAVQKIDWNLTTAVEERNLPTEYIHNPYGDEDEDDEDED